MCIYVYVYVNKYVSTFQVRISELEAQKTKLILENTELKQQNKQRELVMQSQV